MPSHSTNHSAVHKLSAIVISCGTEFSVWDTCSLYVLRVSKCDAAHFWAADAKLSSIMVQDEVGHDAVQLLDRAMMAPDKPAADCMSAAAPATLYLAVCQDGQHSRDALPLLSGISNLTGLRLCPLLPAGVLLHLLALRS